MKRQKRDRLERAHAQGFKAGLAGRSKDLCPYQQIEHRSEWLGGDRKSTRSELQSHSDLVCRLLLEKKKTNK